MLELIIAGMMSCNLAGQEIIESGDRQCKYKCQDKSIEYVSTSKQFQCPRRLYVENTKKSFRGTRNQKKDNKKNK